MLKLTRKTCMKKKVNSVERGSGSTTAKSRKLILPMESRWRCQNQKQKLNTSAKLICSSLCCLILVKTDKKWIRNRILSYIHVHSAMQTKGWEDGKFLYICELSTNLRNWMMEKLMSTSILNSRVCLQRQKTKAKQVLVRRACTLCVLLPWQGKKWFQVGCFLQWYATTCVRCHFSSCQTAKNWKVNCSMHAACHLELGLYMYGHQILTIFLNFKPFCYLVDLGDRNGLSGLAFLMLPEVCCGLFFFNFFTFSMSTVWCFVLVNSFCKLPTIFWYLLMQKSSYFVNNEKKLTSHAKIHAVDILEHSKHVGLWKLRTEKMGSSAARKMTKPWCFEASTVEHVKAAEPKNKRTMLNVFQPPFELLCAAHCCSLWTCIYINLMYISLWIFMKYIRIQRHCISIPSESCEECFLETKWFCAPDVHVWGKALQSLFHNLCVFLFCFPSCLCHCAWKR